MSARVFTRIAIVIAGAIGVLAGCGGGTSSTSSAPSLPIAAQFNLTFVNSVIHGGTQSGISFKVTASTSNCLRFPQGLSDNRLDYNDSAERTVWLLDCGTSGSFTVRFHALDVTLADTSVSWTVSESGLNESVVDQGGLCINRIRGSALKERISAKPPSGCPPN